MFTEHLLCTWPWFSLDCALMAHTALNCVYDKGWRAGAFTYTGALSNLGGEGSWGPQRHF